jgi:toxin-antitoxin system PIN domain toxin
MLRSCLSSTIEVAWLLDVNALIALISPGHIHHDQIHFWFARHSSRGWATCPITENGAIRIMSQPSYAGGRSSPEEIVGALRATMDVHAQHHRFWGDQVSLTDTTLFCPEKITSSSLVTDAYLLGLAAKHGARLVSFDRTLPWQAIRNGTARLIETPLLQ